VTTRWHKELKILERGETPIPTSQKANAEREVRKAIGLEVNRRKNVTAGKTIRKIPRRYPCKLGVGIGGKRGNQGAYHMLYRKRANCMHRKRS